MVHEVSPAEPKDTPLFLPYLIATIAGVIVNSVVLVLIWRQTKINWRQAKINLRVARAAKISARLQEANLRQWVDMQAHGILVETTSKSDPPKEITISLRWKIINNTSLPFTLEKIDTKICRDKDWEVFEMSEDDVVPPVKEGSRNFYPFFVPLKLTKRQTQEFLTDGITLSIATRITYVDASGKRKEQMFGDFYECDFDKMKIVEPLGKAPTFVGIEEGGEEPDIVVDKRTKILEKASEPPTQNPHQNDAG